MPQWFITFYLAEKKCLGDSRILQPPYHDYQLNWSPKGFLSTDNSPFTSPTDWMASWILLLFAMENHQKLANDWFYHKKYGKSCEFHGNSRTIAIIFDWSKMGNWGTGLVLLGGALRTSGRLPDPAAWLGESSDVHPKNGRKKGENYGYHLVMTK